MVADQVILFPLAAQMGHRVDMTDFMGIGQVRLGAGFHQIWNLMEIRFECHGGKANTGRTDSPGENLRQTPEVVDKDLEISFLSELLKRFPLQRVNGDVYMMYINMAQPLQVPASEFYR